VERVVVELAPGGRLSFCSASVESPFKVTVRTTLDLLAVANDEGGEGRSSRDLLTF